MESRLPVDAAPLISIHLLDASLINSDIWAGPTPESLKINPQINQFYFYGKDRYPETMQVKVMQAPPKSGEIYDRSHCR